MEIGLQNSGSHQLFLKDHEQVSKKREHVDNFGDFHRLCTSFQYLEVVMVLLIMEMIVNG